MTARISRPVNEVDIDLNMAKVSFAEFAADGTLLGDDANDRTV
jgi:hypothetical protein